MSLHFKKVFLAVITWIVIKNIICTIDLNSAELQYLADHLTGEECRTLVAAAHLPGHQEPNVLDLVERTVPKDLPCIELLHHWNSEPGEGKGETHEVLQLRLRQIGKDALADWLGRTVFHEIGKDLNRTVEKGFKELAAETTEVLFIAGPTLAPVVENADPTEWSPIDTILYVIMVGLIAVIVGLCCKVCHGAFLRWRKSRKRKVRFKKSDSYNYLDETSGSESEDKFDVRDYSDRANFTSSEGDS